MCVCVVSVPEAVCKKERWRAAAAAAVAAAAAAMNRNRAEENIPSLYAADVAVTNPNEPYSRL